MALLFWENAGSMSKDGVRRDVHAASWYRTWRLFGCGEWLMTCGFGSG